MIRILVEAILLDADLKHKEAVGAHVGVLIGKSVAISVPQICRTHGGIAGCARLSAKLNRKRAFGWRLERLTPSRNQP